MARSLFFLTALLSSFVALNEGRTVEPASEHAKPIETRRAEYLEWIVEHFGNLEPAMYRSLDL